MRHALIMAGGSGTRLWPLSRRNRPKQLLRLFEGRSLLQHARARLAGLFEPERIWVITSAAYIDLVAEELPDIPRENLIGEPVGRDTANAIGLAAHVLALRDDDATMAVFTADHLISPQDVFAAAIRRGLEVAEAHPRALVTFGIEPTEPHTGYGYVQMGDVASPADADGPAAHRVRSFREKPDRSTAEAYLASGEYLWNSGMFAWRAEAILAELSRCLPENDAELKQLARAWGSGASDDAARRFGGLKKISIDYGVMEKAEQVLTVPLACRWLDLGSWSAIAQTREADERGNVAIADHAMLVDGGGNIVVSEDEHLLVTLGVSDIVVVHSDDVTLVCRRCDEQRVKQLVEMCGECFGDRFL
ncbi:MAG: mannose-1-phosphate guanylyltransferase [Planctomycetota bacterium]|nr:MAG: mannose-1-phosphate guanylyltransferase [Planctomycetota bacterium]